MNVLQLDLFDDARLPVVLAMGAADPHANLTRCIAAQHRTIVHEHGPHTMARSRDGGTNPCQPAPNDAELSLMLDRPHVHCSMAAGTAPKGDG